MKIGIFDSGIGGLSVLHEAYHILPAEKYFFYADVDNVPYGVKSEEQIIGYCRKAVSFFVEKNVDIILIACNTATSVAIDILRDECPIPIVGTEPAVKTAVNCTPEDKRILVIATPVTLREEKLHSLIARVDSLQRVDMLPAPKLVTFAEKEIFDTEEVEDYLRTTFYDIDMSTLGAIVLGCTHFNYFKPLYRRIAGKDVKLIDGNDAIVCHLADVAGISCDECGAAGTCRDGYGTAGISRDRHTIYFDSVEDMMRKSGTDYFQSGRIVTDQNALAHFMRLHNRLEDVRDI